MKKLILLTKSQLLKTLSLLILVLMCDSLCAKADDGYKIGIIHTVNVDSISIVQAFGGHIVIIPSYGYGGLGGNNQNSGGMNSNFGRGGLGGNNGK